MAEQKTISTIEIEEPSSVKLIITLGLAGFLSGLILVGVYLFTKPIIAENKARALKEAIFKVLPGTTDFVTLYNQNGTLVEIANEANSESDQSENIYLGFDQQNALIGFAIPGSEPGFQDIIGALYGYEAKGQTIIGFEVLESKETPGLGDKIFKDPDFQTNFTALQVEPEINVVKKGKKENDNEVEAITGATISSRAIVRLLNKSLDKWQPLIEDYLSSKETKISFSKTLPAPFDSLKGAHPDGELGDDSPCLAGRQALGVRGERGNSNQTATK